VLDVFQTVIKKMIWISYDAVSARTSRRRVLASARIINQKSLSVVPTSSRDCCQYKSERNASEKLRQITGTEIDDKKKLRYREEHSSSVVLSWRWSPANIRINITSPETRRIVLPDAEYRTILSSFVWTQYRNVRDGQTDGRNPSS